MEKSGTVTFETGYLFGGVHVDSFETLNEAVKNAARDGYNYVVVREDRDDLPAKLKLIGWGSVELLDFSEVRKKLEDTPYLVRAFDQRSDKNVKFVYCGQDNSLPLNDKRNLMSANHFAEVTILDKQELERLLQN